MWVWGALRATALRAPPSRIALGVTYVGPLADAALRLHHDRRPALSLRLGGKARLLRPAAHSRPARSNGRAAHGAVDRRPQRPVGADGFYVGVPCGRGPRQGRASAVGTSLGPLHGQSLSLAPSTS